MGRCHHAQFMWCQESNWTFTQQASTPQPELHARSRVDTLTYRTYASFYLPIPVCWLIFQGSPGCPGTCFVDRAGHEIRDLSASRVLGLKVCSSTALHNYTILQKYSALKLHHSLEFGCSHRHSKTTNVAGLQSGCCFNLMGSWCTLPLLTLTCVNPRSVCRDHCSCTLSLLLEQYCTIWMHSVYLWIS